MPRKPDAEAIARMTCPTPDCGQTVAVYQNRRGYLYTRCGKCGADQRNGAEAQRYFWTHATPVPGVDPASIKQPRNVPASFGPIGSKPVQESVPEPEQVPAKPEPARVAVDDRDPAPEPVREPAPEPIGETSNKTRKGGMVVLVLSFLGILVAAAAAKGAN